MRCDAYLDLISFAKDIRFTQELIRHANTTSKLADVAFVCAIDMCRAGFRISPEGEMPLRHIAADISHEIKVVANAQI